MLSWKRHWSELATFFNYPEAVRRLIYTTNPIESLNSRVRKTVKGKSVFPTEIALFKALYLAVAEAEKRWTMRARNWQEIMAPSLSSGVTFSSFRWSEKSQAGHPVIRGAWVFIFLWRRGIVLLV